MTDQAAGAGTDTATDTHTATDTDTDTATDRNTFTFTGDRGELESWLAVSGWRVARGITLEDGSLLLHHDDQHGGTTWASVAPDQTLVRNGDDLRVSSVAGSLAASISGLIMGAMTIDAELLDAEANRQVQDYARRKEMLTKARATAQKLLTDARALESRVVGDSP